MTQEEKELFRKAIPERLLSLKVAIERLDAQVATSLNKLGEDNVINAGQVEDLKKMRSRARLDFMDSYQRFNLVCQKINNELKNI